MFKGWKDFFYLNRGEQRAMLILFTLIIIVYGMLIYSKMQSGSQSVDTVAFAREIKAFEHQIDSAGFYQPKQFSIDNGKRHPSNYAVNEKAKPLTLRFDLPVFINRPPYANPQYATFRYVVGINRTF